MAEGNEPRIADEAAARGVLVCHVYRKGPWCAYLSHAGAHEALELDAIVSCGGDWEEANVIHEDGPPMPPRENGLWEMRMPWRPAKHVPADRPPTEGDEDLYDDDELCCIYTAKPTWTLLAAAPSISASTGGKDR